ncbi:hypothetical protein FEM33_19835 [Dyadobacter flavalbus]|uniref:Uncharacterized protein n=1 Tax=Dyadobacter flavalbus TaxID=2579942 RepID=A0A5M8QLG6_9BACT|nr:hypothetical protein [Dyadobacter flavalbus]KAA6436975.1 hypothetical protein FEM33_19835 [Dyadobacter flavalbus]
MGSAEDGNKIRVHENQKSTLPNKRMDCTKEESTQAVKEAENLVKTVRVYSGNKTLMSLKKILYTLNIHFVIQDIWKNG